MTLFFRFPGCHYHFLINNCELILCCTLQDIRHVYYETEFRTEWCQSNSTFVPCYLFARKFSRGAATRLLTEGVVGPFDASSLLLRVQHDD